MGIDKLTLRTPLHFRELVYPRLGIQAADSVTHGREGGAQAGGGAALWSIYLWVYLFPLAILTFKSYVKIMLTWQHQKMIVWLEMEEIIKGQWAER